jgi:hypothetical protein
LADRFTAFPLMAACCRVLRSLCAHAAMCTFGIDELRQHPAEILLLWRHAEEHAFRAHVPVGCLHVGDGEPQFDFPAVLFFR